MNTRRHLNPVLTVGMTCFYLNRDTGRHEAAIVTGWGEKDGYKVIDVKIKATGEEKWGYEEQIKH